MRICFETGGPNPFEGAKTKSLITLSQKESGAELFTVTYGLQIESDLTYSGACKELGRAILHHLCCESLASNSGA